MKRHPDASVDQRLWFRAREMFVAAGFPRSQWNRFPDVRQQWYDQAWTELRSTEKESTP